MNKNSLHDQVARLHAELAEALRADPKSREALSDMMRDIDRLIDSRLTDKGALTGKGADTPALVARGSLVGRLETIAVQFEAAHPTLAASARRLVDLLGEVGI